MKTILHLHNSFVIFFWILPQFSREKKYHLKKKSIIYKKGAAS